MEAPASPNTGAPVTNVETTTSYPDNGITPKQEKRLRHKLQRFTKKYGNDLFTGNPADIRTLGTVDGMMERYFTPQRLSFDPSENTDYILKVKLQLLTLRAQRALDRLPGIFLKEVSQKMSTYGLVHAALQIGPYRFDWTPDSFSFPRPIFNETPPILMLDLPKGVLYSGRDWAPIEKICRKICAVAVRWNCNKEYGIKNHCQRFVYELLVVLRILSPSISLTPSSPTLHLSPRSDEDDEFTFPVPTKTNGSESPADPIMDLGFQEPISSFLGHLHKNGTSSMRYRPPSENDPGVPLADDPPEKSELETVIDSAREEKGEAVETGGGKGSGCKKETSEVLIFTTHEELDRYTRKLLKQNPRFRERYPHHWQLLKAFDRAFWAASVELKQREEEKRNEDRERQAKETLDDLRRMRQKCKEESEKQVKDTMEEQARLREEEMRKKKQTAEGRWKLWKEEVERQARETLEDLHRLREEDKKKQVEEEEHVPLPSSAAMHQQQQEPVVRRKGSVRVGIKKILKKTTFGGGKDGQESSGSNSRTPPVSAESLDGKSESRLTRSFSDSDMDKDGELRKRKRKTKKEKEKEEEDKKKPRRKRSGRRGKKEKEKEKEKEREKEREKQKRKREKLKQKRKSMKLTIRYGGDEKNGWEAVAVRSNDSIDVMDEEYITPRSPLGGTPRRETPPESAGKEVGGFVMKIDPKTVYVTCPFGSPLDLNASFAHIAYKKGSVS